MNLESWLTRIESIHPRTIDLGLQRIHRVAEKLSIHTFQCVVITVAGTNGKGSCIACLEAILRAAGLRVGTYTSPHLLKYNERIRINGQAVSNDCICESFEAIDGARDDVSLTYFEFGTLAAFHIFHQHDLDVVLLEVGLGGRLDAVNIIDSDIAIVTSIALDHTDWLGHDRESIGREKAGIFRAGKPIVFGEHDMPTSMIEYAKQLKSPIFKLGEDYNYVKNGDTWSFSHQEQTLIDLPQPQLYMQNAVTALMAIQLLQTRLAIPKEAISLGLQTAMIAGRFHYIPGPVSIILDVAHNPHGAQVFAARLKELSLSGRVIAVWSMLSEKDHEQTVAPLRDLVDCWFLADLNIPRAANIAALTSALMKQTYRDYCIMRSAEAAYRAAQAEAKRGDCIIVFGSFYTVAKIMQMGIMAE